MQARAVSYLDIDGLSTCFAVDNKEENMRDAYIVTSIRTPGCKRNKGAFRDTRPEDLLTFILNEAVSRTPNLGKPDVQDIMIGCCFPEAEQGLNIGRLAGQ